MTEAIEQNIKTLLVDDVAKNKLRTINKLLNSNSKKVRESTYALLVTAGEGCGFSSYGRVYSEIVDASNVHQTKGSTTFLELVFPKDSQREEKLFFSSPRRAASIRNRFYGTMLISLKEYKGLDLIRSESFLKLLDFISLNRNNIHFVFHILPEFDAKVQLLMKLQEVLNVTEVTLNNPSLDNGYEYVISELKKYGYVFDKKALKLLREDVLPHIIQRESYLGYKTLNLFMDRLHLEVALTTDGENKVLSKDTLEYLADKYKLEEKINRSEVSKIGFHM